MIAILQPLVPHYREEFFKGIQQKSPVEIYCYLKKQVVANANFKEGTIKTKFLKSIQMGPFLIFNPFSLLNKEVKTIVLMLHQGHLTSWLLLLTQFIHRKKIIVWGQGISVKRYLNEEKRPNLFLKLMIGLSDTVWLYTNKEQNQWSAIFPKKQIVSLNNTISEVTQILAYQSKESKGSLKEKHKITEKTCFLFCARFNNPHRRVDLLEEIIKKMDVETYGFIIIGDGPFKPDFSVYKNVYDFGSVYDSKIKEELFIL